LLSCVLLFGALISPVAILIFYWYNFEWLGDKNFRNKYGTVYDGYKTNQFSAVLIPFFYTTRRILFAACVLFLCNFGWGQFFCLVYTTLFSACYLLHTNPIESRGYLEVMNEVTLLFMINLGFNFTDLIDDTETQYTAGWLYIAVFCGNIAVHLSLIIFDGGKSLI